MKVNFPRYDEEPFDSNVPFEDEQRPRAGGGFSV